MAHFFEFIQRMIAGKPVFEDETKHDVAPRPIDTPASDVSQSAIRKNEQQTFPVVRIRRVSTHLDGDTVRIYCHIQNTWPQEIMLDKIRLLGTMRELDTYLRGGEEREFLVYKGPKLTQEVHEAQLDYKTVQEGDYFRAMHDARFTYHPGDKSYTLDELRLHMPIRDIYE